MTKKYLLSAFMLTTTLATAVQATELNPYVGAGYTFADAGYGSGFDALAESKHHAGFISAGVRPHQNWGVEAFYQLSKDEDKTFGNMLNTETGFQAAGVDVLGYVPVHDKVDLIGTVGLGYYWFKADYSGVLAGSEKENNLGWRIGAGAQYHMTDNVSVRGMVRYVKLHNDSVDVVDDLTDVSVGVYWHF